jgi:hypothetical protein
MPDTEVNVGTMVQTKVAKQLSCIEAMIQNLYISIQVLTTNNRIGVSDSELSNRPLESKSTKAKEATTNIDDAEPSRTEPKPSNSLEEDRTLLSFAATRKVFSPS